METRSGPDEDPASTPETHEPWDERAEQLRGLASRHGLRYLSRYPSEDPFGIKDAPFRWLKRRLRPKLSNVLIGSYRATEIVAFDFALDGLVLGGSEYSAGYSNYGVTATCALAKIPWSAPRLTLTPWTDKGLLRRCTSWRGQARRSTVPSHLPRHDQGPAFRSSVAAAEDSRPAPDPGTRYKASSPGRADGRGRRDQGSLDRVQFAVARPRACRHPDAGAADGHRRRNSSGGLSGLGTLPPPTVASMSADTSKHHAHELPVRPTA